MFILQTYVKQSTSSSIPLYYFTIVYVDYSGDQFVTQLKSPLSHLNKMVFLTFIQYKKKETNIVNKMFLYTIDKLKNMSHLNFSFVFSFSLPKYNHNWVLNDAAVQK